MAPGPGCPWTTTTSGAGTACVDAAGETLDDEVEVCGADADDDGKGADNIRSFCASAGTHASTLVSQIPHNHLRTDFSR